MKSSTLVLLGGAAVLGVALVVVMRRQTSPAVITDPHATKTDAIKSALDLGSAIFGYLSPKETKDAIDGSTARNPAPTGLSANYTQPPIGNRGGAQMMTYADWATAGIYA